MKHPNLTPLVGTKVIIETREGAVQVGKLTKVNYIETQLNGETVHTPKTLEFNGDASEFSDWDRIATIRRAP